MAVTEAYTGTEAVSTTEWSLTTDTSGPDTQTAAGAYQVFLDLNALVKGDQFQIKVYEKVRSSDTQRVVFTEFVSNIQGDPVWVSPTLLLLNGWDVTLLKVAGADETITWSIRKAG